MAPLGYLAYKFGLFPKALAGVLVLETICYLIDLLAAFTEFGRMIHGFVVIPCAVAEIWMVFYLLIIGVRTPKKSRQPQAYGLGNLAAVQPRLSTRTWPFALQAS